MHNRTYAQNQTRLIALGVLLLLGASSTLAQTAPAQSNGKPLYLDPTQSADARTKDLISRLTLEEKATLLNHVGADVTRFNIQSDKWNQCLHGVVWEKPTTMFPVSIAAAATWDPALVHTEATAISDEARAIYNSWHTDPNYTGTKKGLMYRSPVINISRNPYWGRINECYGEDPFLTGRMGVAYVEGLQGDDPKYLKLVATLKHFAVNNVENNRKTLSATVSERMLYEYYLPHFRDCIVEGHAESIMASYNAINGVHNNVNKLLLTDILRDQWGFQGFVVSDLGGVGSIVGQRGQATVMDAVSKSLIAGCDFSDKEFEQNIPNAVRQGVLPLADVDESVFRVMHERFRLGDFDPPALVPFSKITTDVIDSPEHRALSLKMARESIVLLTNKNNFLPLDRSKLKTIAVIGPHANIFTAGGYSGRAQNPVTPLQGIKNRAGAGIDIEYTQGGAINIGGGAARAGRAGRGAAAPAFDAAAELTKAVDLAKKADVVILYVVTDLGVEGEGHDRPSLGLPGNQQQLVDAVIAANPKTVVVEMNAGPLAVPAIADHAAALVEAWWGGEEGGNAVADVLFGDVNPSGHMPLTVYASAQQVPPQDQYDITKGFTYMYLKAKPLFAFGHGLSYTQFKYDNLQLAAKTIKDDGNVEVNVDITNVGPRAGDEVAQLYVHQVKCSVVRAAEELRGFQRVSLQPGEKKTITLQVPAQKLAFYDETVHKFVVEPGTFDIMIGSASDDIRLNDQIQVTK